MDSRSFYSPLKVLAVAVLALMVLAVLYGCYIAISYWSGIAV